MRTRQWAPNLDFFGRRSDYRRCLALVWQAIGSSGSDEYDALLPYQRRMLSDLDEGIDEQAISHLHEWWRYDISGLMKRSRYEGEPAKPRVDLDIELTSKGNLKCEWRPTGIDQWGRAQRNATPDWIDWWRSENRSGGWDSRPSNELFFIHDVEYALETVRSPRNDVRSITALNAVLLRCATALVETLKSRLEFNFEVTMVTDVFETWRAGADFKDPDQLLSWQVDDPERRQNDAELAELGSISKRLGFTEKQFEELWGAQLIKKRTGPTPTGSVEQVAPKVAKAFRLQGLSDITAHETKRVRYLIDKHRAPKRPQRSADILAFPSDGSINGGD